MRYRQEDCRCGQYLKNCHDDVSIFYKLEQYIQELTSKYFASKAIKKLFLEYWIIQITIFVVTFP